MASIYSDDYRLVRYSKLRKQRDIIEKILGFSMLIALVCAAGEVIPALLESILGGFALLREIGDFFLAVLGIFCMAGAIYAVYKREWIITLVALVLLPILTAFGAVRYLGVFQPVPLLAALICDIFWLKLSKEDGFPQFQLELNRHEATEKAWDFTSRKNAVESGARTAATGTAADSDMHDLLDETAETLNADLKGYQDRSQGADPFVHPAETHSEMMDSLEDL